MSQSNTSSKLHKSLLLAFCLIVFTQMPRLIILLGLIGFFIKYRFNKETVNVDEKCEKVSKRQKNSDSDFISFSSLTNHYHDKVKDFINNPDSKQKHIVQEKLDGSNFSIRMNDSNEIIFCSRNRVLNGQFHNYESVVPDLSKYAENIFNEFGNSVYIFGELMGCGYMDLPVKRKNSRFQNKVEYTNDLVFISYDIYNSKTKTYINSSIALDALKNAGFIVSPVLATYNSLEEALKHDEVFSSTIPELLGMSKHNLKNEAEGIVIRPLERDYYINEDRGIFKKKNISFQETVKRGPKAKKPNKNSFLDEYITEPRWNNVRSKYGDNVTKSEMSEAYVEDVFKDIRIDYENSSDSAKIEILGFLDQPKRVGNYRKHIQSKISSFIKTIE